jgi:hypothetical protein
MGKKRAPSQTRTKGWTLAVHASLFLPPSVSGSSAPHLHRHLQLLTPITHTPCPEKPPPPPPTESLPPPPHDKSKRAKRSRSAGPSATPIRPIFTVHVFGPKTRLSSAPHFPRAQRGARLEASATLALWSVFSGGMDAPTRAALRRAAPRPASVRRTTSHFRIRRMRTLQVREERDVRPKETRPSILHTDAARRLNVSRPPASGVPCGPKCVRRPTLNGGRDEGRGERNPRADYRVVSAGTDCRKLVIE